MAKNLNMTQGNPLKLLIQFALPLMFGNMFQQLYTVVDTAIVGQGVGMEALAALGGVDWLNWMMVGIAQGFTQGFGVRISQKYGEEDIPGLRRFMGQSAVLSAVLALMSVALGQLLLPAFLMFLRVPAELRGMANLYTRILFGGLPAVFFFNYCSAMLRAVGDSKTPLIAMAIAAMLNIGLDIVAVFGLGWGIAGAAAATLLSQCVSGTICLIKIFRTPFLRFGKDDLAIDRQTLGNLIKIGTPSAAKNTIISIGGMTIMTVVNTFGTAFIAGFTSTNKLYGLLEICALSYGFAVTTYVGQNYGAGRFDRIRSGMKSAAVLAVATAVIIATLMFVFGRPITMLFISTENPADAVQAGNVAYRYLCIMSSWLPVLYILYLLFSALQGLGDTVRPMISGLVELGCRVSVAVTVAILGRESGIFLAEVFAWTGAVIYLGYHFRKRMKKGI